MIENQSQSNSIAIEQNQVQVFQDNLQQLFQQINDFFKQEESMLIQDHIQNEQDVIEKTQDYLQQINNILNQIQDQKFDIHLDLKIWNKVINKLSSKNEISQIYLKVLEKLNKIMTLNLDDIIEILSDIYKQNLHKGEMLCYLCDSIQYFGVTQKIQSILLANRHKKWELLLEFIFEMLLKRSKDLTFNLRGITILNLLLKNNNGLCFVKQFDFINHLQQLIYLFIDNQFICEQIIQCQLLIYHQSKNTVQVYLIKINQLLSLMIQHFQNDTLVLQTLQIIGSLDYLKENAFSFFDLEIIRILFEWSQYIKKFDKKNQINKQTASIILQIFHYLKISYQEKLKKNTDYLKHVCYNFVELFSESKILMVYCTNLLIFSQLENDTQMFEIKNIQIIQKFGAQYLYNIDIFNNFLRIISLIALKNEQILENLVSNSNINNLLLSSLKIYYNIPEGSSIIANILQYLINVSANETLCFIIWEMDITQQIFYSVIHSELRNNILIVKLLLNLLQILSQIENIQQFINRNIKFLIQIIEKHVLVYEISDDYIIILQNLISSTNFSIQQIIDEFLPITLDIIRNQSENQSFVYKIYEIYDQLSKHDLQTRLKIQDLCQTVMDEQIQEKINPCFNTLNEFVGRQSVSYENLLTQEAKEYLINGVNCKLYKEDGSISNLLVFITYDLACIWCKHKSDQITKQKWRLATKHVISIKDYLNDIEGWRQSPFKKYGKKKIDINCCFTITGNIILNKQIQLQHFHICAPTQQDKYKMFEYLKVLIQMN